MKTLFQICLSCVSRNLDTIGKQVDNALPGECKDLILEWLSSHDLLTTPSILQLLARPAFVSGLTTVNFYLSEQIDDELLITIGAMNKRLTHVTIVYCSGVADRGVRALTEGQSHLAKLELKGVKQLTSYGIAGVNSNELRVIDLSDCPHVCSSGIVHLVTHNPSIQKIFLNSCASLDDLSVYAIGAHLGSSLLCLELDFMDHLRDPSAAITYLTEHCPNLSQLSLRRYFASTDSNSFLHLECSLQSKMLRELDLYGNYFSVLPKLPSNITNLRLSCSGTENVQDLTSRLQALPNLKDIRIMLSSREVSDTAVESASDFLEIVLPLFGPRITSLQLMVYRIRDKTLNMILDHCTRLHTLSLNVVYISAAKLIEMFQDRERACAMKTIKFYRLQLPCKVLFAIARYCVNLEEIEFSFMPCVDDRFLKTLGSNCARLRVVNFNGCQWVTDKGLCALARGCPLKEIRVRATSVTDKCVYVLAQCCPNLEWIAHADYTGRPKFSDDALKTLKDSCVQRVIC